MGEGIYRSQTVKKIKSTDKCLMPTRVSTKTTRDIDSNGRGRMIFAKALVVFHHVNRGDGWAKPFSEYSELCRPE
eukprot:1319859-Amorphochlora_amoeboformis.AAC.2